MTKLLTKQKNSLVWTIVSVHLLACQDFSKFDCFNESKGCNEGGTNYSSDNEVRGQGRSMILPEGETPQSEETSEGVMPADIIMECSPLSDLGPCRRCTSEGFIRYTQNSEGCSEFPCDKVQYNLVNDL